MARIRVGQSLEITALRLAPSGDAVAEHEGVEVRVPSLLPGETARVSVVHRATGAARVFATLEEMHEPASARRAAQCEHADACSGCPLMVAEPTLALALKCGIAGELLGVPIDEVVSAPNAEWGYRWSSKRVVGGQPGDLILGSYRRGTHRLTTMQNCRVDHPAIAEAARHVTKVANETGIAPYDEATKSGDLRYVWLKTNEAGEVMVTLITGAADSRAAEVAARLDAVAGAFWCTQSSQGNAIRGTDVRHVHGKQTLDVTLFGTRRPQGPLAFLQPNPPIAERCYAEMVRGLSGDLALDLYAGAGITAERLRNTFKRVTAVESFPEAAAALGVTPQSVSSFLRDWTPEAGAGPDAVLANPPRAGMGPEVCADLLRLHAPSLHVMSCHPASMARDLKQLRAGYDVASVRAYDTLPHTMHLELVARLVRKPR